MFMLGDFGSNLEFYRESDWLVVFIATIFNIILLLNLLIAIISDTYGQVSEKAIATKYKEKVFQIYEMQNSIFGQFRFFKSKEDVDSNELIFIANVKPAGKPKLPMIEKIE